MRLAVLKERGAFETRVAATPDTVKKLIGLGLTVAVESGAGLSAAISDADFHAAGAEISPDSADVYKRQVEDMLNTVVRQIAFYNFETRLHDERRTGELVPDRIGEIWMEVQTTSLGPAFEFTPEYKVFWSYVPHFIHSPFYVYAYASVSYTHLDVYKRQVPPRPSARRVP